MEIEEDAALIFILAMQRRALASRRGLKEKLSVGMRRVGQTLAPICRHEYYSHIDYLSKTARLGKRRRSLQCPAHVCHLCRAKLSASSRAGGGQNAANRFPEAFLEAA